MKKTFLFFGLIAAVLFFQSELGAATDKIKIVTTTSAFASIAKEIAGDKAEIYSIASPKRDIHFISPTPKDVVKLKKSEVFIHAGLDLEAWRGPLLDAVGRTELMWPSGEKQIDVSKGIPLLEIPTSISRAQGDIHLYGNPHYWMDPENAKIIAHNIAEGLARIFPQDALTFEENAKKFDQKIDEKLKDWTSRLLEFKGASFVTYHRDWSYFAHRFGLIELGELEPKPGIPPTAKHLAELVNLMKEKKSKLIFKETYQESRTPNRLAEETGARVLPLTQAVGDPQEASDYFSMMDYNVQRIEQTRKS